MSLSLSSLLNPSPPDDKDNQAQTVQPATSDDQQHSPTQRRESLPPISYVQSPELLHTQLPTYTPPQRPRPTAPPALSSIAEQYGSTPHSQPGQDGQTTSGRSISGGGHATTGTFELPPPPVTGARKMSSPTLDQYHVASRSPEERKTSAQTSSGFVLPPLQTVATGDAQEHRMLPNEELSERQREKPSHVQLNTTAHEPIMKEESSEKHSITIKQEEAAASPQDTTSSDLRRLSTQNNEQDSQLSKTLSSLKNEYTSRTHSPLRESSIALPTTEQEPSPNTPAMKKRPPPTRVKKGTATAAKKPRPLHKKRKLDTKSNALKNGSSVKGTPGMSPTPSDAHGEEFEDEDESMVDSDEDVEGSGDVYCICRKPDNGTFMIGCDGQCDDWFHGKCVSIEERDKNLIDKYICPSCTEEGVGRTSWKRMCRRQGCRLPARVGKNAGKNGSTSKYCSDECGVQTFRQMTANARGAEQARKDRVTRRKNGVADTTDSRAGDAGARGSTLSTGEVRALLDQTDTAAEFRELGNGVLSPPATPSGKNHDADDGISDLDRNAIKTIASQKEQARQRHQTLKDRLKFITLVKNEASRAAVERDLKPKEYCGFDSRLEWTEEEFATWHQTQQGQQAFDLESLEPSPVQNGVDADMTTDDIEEHEVCSRKKCARHTDWSKLAVDDVRFEMTDNSDHMRSLEQQEHDIRERASVRAKARKFGEDEGSVEVHGSQTVEAMRSAVQPAAAMTSTIAPMEGMPSTGEPAEAMELDTTA